MKIIKLVFILNICVLLSIKIFAQSINIDKCDDLSNWQKVTSDGVSMHLSLVPGINGKAIKIDYQFTGSGYCGIVKNISLSLDSNYKFIFFVKGTPPKNNLEFKLDDSTGDNVWWHIDRGYDFPVKWTKRTLRKRDISFAWGPSGGGILKKMYKLEIMISAAEGGNGTVYIDDLSYTKLLPPVTKIIEPIVKASSSLNSNPSQLMDNNPISEWRSKPNENQNLLFDFQYLREYGGVIINWDSLDYATDFNINVSNDLKNWKTIYHARSEKRTNSFIPLPDDESRYMKIVMLKSNRGKGYAIKGIKIENYKFVEDNNYFFEQVAKNYPEGYFPKYLSKVQTYWDVIGVNGDDKEGLINEEGMIETGKESFSIEPFLYANGKYINWNNVKTTQSLVDNYLPVPIVRWTSNGLKLEIKALAGGQAGKSSIYVRYRITNSTMNEMKGSLYLTLRPFQVSPPWQFLNLKGGVAKIHSITYSNGTATVNNTKQVISLTKPTNFGAVQFTNGSIVNYINKNILPNAQNVKDSLGFGSAAFKYDFDLQPKGSHDVVISVPLYKDSYQPAGNNIKSADLFFKNRQENVSEYWRSKLDKVKFDLPQSEKKMINTLKSSLAYILINRDGSALQPGSRSYERAWIRDGALMGAALLRMGITKEVKEFINWYSEYQFPSGKIPCVVDQRGADPVPENDSQGEFIFILHQYFNFTKDTTFLASKWNNVKKTVNYIEHQIKQETTGENKNGTNEQKSFYGLVPASISHEGYSAKPMHSYWDDFFVMKGLKDAVTIAHILDKKKEENEYIKLRDTFRKNLYHSIHLAMENKNINYIPGCAELGDFDATSTAIGIFPCGELKYLPQPQLENTFDKYFKFFNKRLSPADDWKNFTPYELRVAGAFIYLHEINRTYDLLNYFFKFQRPEGWNHWAEVVWKDRNEPKFIGDMPHTWVGSGYINTFRALFVYEDEDDSTLVLGAGIKSEWLNRPKGISVEDLPTYYGNISYSIKRINPKAVEIKIKNNIKDDHIKLLFKNPVNKEMKQAVSGKGKRLEIANNYIYINPSEGLVKIQY